MLDDKVETFDIPQKCHGQVLFEEVVRRLRLLEMDYFDLEYTDHQGNVFWLDHEKLVLKQLPINELNFKFLIKFYSPDPGLLEEEYTRYLFALQLRRDLSTGAMPCQEHTAVLLASYVVQAELGDFLEDEYVDHRYLSALKLLPVQTEDIEVKIMEHHKEHIGQSPAEADFNLLDTARKVELYGIRMHAAKDHEGVSLNLACAHMGVLVFQNITKINTFSWAKIRKLSFKRKKFLIKLHPEGYNESSQGYYKDTVEFYCETRNECKNFWKKCIEHHAFFRCHNVKRLTRNKTRVMSRGSSFRYCGRTQKQLTEYVRDNFTKRPTFERSASMRTMSCRATPNTSTLNSRDIRFGEHNASTSSGSHILDTGRDDEPRGRLSQSADLHDERNRSYSSPRRDNHDGYNTEPHTRSQEWNHRDSHGGPGDHRSLDRRIIRDQDNMQEKPLNHVAGGEHEEQQPIHSGPAHPSPSPRAHRIDPRQFMLTHDDRKFSAPVFSVGKPQDNSIIDDQYLRRSPEVTNIPEKVHEDDPGISFLSTREGPPAASSPYFNTRDGAPVSSPRDMRRINSETGMGNPPAYTDVQYNNSHGQTSPSSYPSPPQEHPTHIGVNKRNGSIDEEPLPPPPPPIYEDETPRERIKSTGVMSARDRRDEMRSVATSRSTTSAVSTSAASFTFSGSASITSSRGTTDSEEDVRRKRSPADKAYYVAKELLMTERTYKKDLEVLTVWFRNSLQKESALPEPLDHLLFAVLDPIYEFHCAFLKEIEQRLAMWEGKSNAHLNGDYQRIGDIMLNNMKVLQLYRSFIEHHEDILAEMETSCRRNKRFETVYMEFEGQKVCYLPLYTFLLKPAQRLLHYKLILERLLKHYTVDHSDYRDCQAALTQVREVTSSFHDRMHHLENMQKLLELQRDLIGMDSIVQNNREFIREGCLQKLSKKGYQQRMFFLFSDMLVYASRTATPMLQFKVHGQLPLRGMIVEQTDVVPNSFTIYGGNKCLPLSASCNEEKDKWMEDLQVAINAAKARGDDGKVLYPSLKSNSSSEYLDDSHEELKGLSPEKQIQHRANTTMHVCWHRNTSVSSRDNNSVVENQLSGSLLRKFKNSNGWQKLWVVFTNFCLFFYKSHQDDFPLASLPLLGYSVTTPSEADGIYKDYVFKLQFKNHVYFFRAESEYTFERWIEVIGSATASSPRHRVFNRNESEG